MEIEKKFLIKSLPELNQYKKKGIEQGYLCREPVVRIRKSNNDYILTYKSKKGLNQDNAIQNEEIEMPLNEEAYRHLCEKADHQLVKKTRYLIPLNNDLVAELDVFEGRLEGLVFAEVEFPSEEAAKSFVPPEWFGEDVSSDRMFSNGYLSEVKDYSEWNQIWQKEKEKDTLS